MILTKNFRALQVLLITVLFATMITGCGKKNSAALNKYKEDMTAFYDKLSYYDKEINSINPDADDAPTQLLTYMDQMNEAYKNMASYDIPEEFESISDISREAAEYMQTANEYYHRVYEGEFDEEQEELARENYVRANNRVMVMLQVLHGEIPEGDNVIVTTEDPGQFATIGNE